VILLITGVGCISKPVIAPPPLPERPMLKSVEYMEHPEHKGVWGFWMNMADMKLLTIYAEQIEAVRAKWK